jgi:hypothetical protein
LDLETKKLTAELNKMKQHRKLMQDKLKQIYLKNQKKNSTSYRTPMTSLPSHSSLSSKTPSSAFLSSPSVSRSNNRPIFNSNNVRSASNNSGFFNDDAPMMKKAGST